jgi:hypothetical protein
VRRSLRRTLLALLVVDVVSSVVVLAVGRWLV